MEEQSTGTKVLPARNCDAARPVGPRLRGRRLCVEQSELFSPEHGKLGIDQRGEGFVGGVDIAHGTNSGSLVALALEAEAERY